MLAKAPYSTKELLKRVVWGNYLAYLLERANSNSSTNKTSIALKTRMTYQPSPPLHVMSSVPNKQKPPTTSTCK